MKRERKQKNRAKARRRTRPGSARKSDGRTRGLPPIGLALLVRIEGDALTVIRSSRTDRIVGRERLRPPRLTRETVGNFPTGTQELALSILDAEGNVLLPIGWPATGRAFFDVADPLHGGAQSGSLAGGLVRLSRSDRLLQVPIAPGAEYLLFDRNTAARNADGEPELRHETLALFGLTPSPDGGPVPEPPLPPHPIDPDVDPTLLPLIDFRGVGAIREPRKKKGYLKHRSGYVKNTQTIVDSGDPNDRFDIVILGDGFKEAELPLFDAKAQKLAHDLLTIAPFSSLKRRINVHTVRAVSVDSGVSKFPTPSDVRKTYFGVEGHFDGATAPTFFGTPFPERVHDATALIAPVSTIELAIVLVNHVVDGGSAPPDLGMAFLPLCPDASRFKNLGAHESAHVIGGMAEEYISCAHPHDPIDVYPNMATDAEKQLKNVWWEALAQPSELNRSGWFKAIQPFPGTFDATGTPIMPARLGDGLGLYWGCQFIDPAIRAPQACDTVADVRGRVFYRPEKTCKMRRSLSGFCRVCRKVLSDAIKAASTP